MAHPVLTPMKFASTSLFCWMFILAVVVPFDAQGQPPWMRDDNGNEAIRERMEAMAVGFLTEELELDAASAQVFWPIYNAHMEQLRTLTDAQREAQIALTSIGEGAADDFETRLRELEEAEVQQARLSASFLRDIAAAFDPAFAVRCVEARKKFQSQFRKRMQQRMSNQQVGGRNSPGRKTQRKRR